MKSIVIVANCQSEALKDMLTEVLPDWEITAYVSHLEHSKEENEQTQENLKIADFIVTQPFKSQNSLDINLHQGDSKSRFIKFPSIYYKGQHPTLTQLRIDGKPVITPGFVYHDGIIAHLVSKSAPDETILQMMTSPDLFSNNFIDNQWQSSLNELKKREIEDNIDVPVSKFIEDHFRHERLFNTFNHPTRRLLAHVTNAILEHIGVQQRVSIQGKDYLNFPVHPILPSVAYHLGGGCISQEQRFHWATKSINYEEFVLLQAKLLRSIEPGQLDAALASTIGLADVITKWQVDQLMHSG